jgi:hypothetical protein
MGWMVNRYSRAKSPLTDLVSQIESSNLMVEAHSTLGNEGRVFREEVAVTAAFVMPSWFFRQDEMRGHAKIMSWFQDCALRSYPATIVQSCADMQVIQRLGASHAFRALHFLRIRAAQECLRGLGCHSWLNGLTYSRKYLQDSLETE